MAIISTEILMDDDVKDRPYCKFVAKKYPEWAGFGDNIAVFWHPNLKCLSDMLLQAGFSKVEEVSKFRLQNTEGGFAKDTHVVVKAYV